MTPAVRDVAAAIRSQRVRLRGSGLRLSVVGVPAVAVGLATLVLVWADPPSGSEGGPWAEVVQASFGLWALFLLPLLTALVAAQVAAVEHDARGWKHLLALPCWKGAHMVSAWVAVAGSTALATAALTVGVAVAGVAVSALRPELGMSTVPVLPLARAAGLVYLCSLPLAGGHLWLSVRWPGIGVGLGVAIGGVLSNVVLLNLGAGVVTPYALAPSALMSDRPWLAAVGVVAGALVLCAASWHSARRDAPA